MQNPRPAAPADPFPPLQATAFLREPLAFPVWLLIFLYGGAGAALGRSVGWSWIGGAAAIALVRVIIAVRALSPLTSPRWARAESVAFVLTHVAQAASWAVLVQAPTSAGHSPLRTATSLAAAMLLSAWCLRGWWRAWVGALIGWSAVTLFVAFRIWGQLPLASIALLVWLPATAWAGFAPPAGGAAAPGRARPTRPGHSPGGSTRRGVQLAIHAADAPMIAVYDGRIFDMNPSAEACLGLSAAQCLGLPAVEVLKLDPPSALDATNAATERDALVCLEPPASADLEARPIKARIRVGRAGGHAAVAVVSLAVAQEPALDHELGTDARRLAEWLGADSTEVWYRDETGQVVLPKRFDAGQAPHRSLDAGAFPLAMLVPEAERPHVDTRYREQLAGGQTFDERLTLIDAEGNARSARVVCLSRPGSGAQPGAVIGIVSDSQARGHWTVQRADLLAGLPMLIWLIDASGRLVHAHSAEVQRWGLRIEPQLRPSWSDAVALQAGCEEPFAQAVQRALDGKPTFDLLNYRLGRTGGRLPLRSHFVPFHAPDGEGKGRRAVMVVDTIASARELLEHERLRLSKAQYKDLVEASPNLIWACDSMFRFTFVSRRACRDVYGHSAEELLGAPLNALLDPAADQTATSKALVGLRNNRALRDVEMQQRTRDGRRLTVAVSAVALSTQDGGFGGAIGINVDVTALKQREARLAEALRVERSVLDSAGGAIAVVKSGAVARCNDAFLQLLQIPPGKLAELPVGDLFAERTQWAEVAEAAERASNADNAVAREIRLRRTAPAGGPEEFIWCQLTLRAVGEGEYVAALADIDHIRRREAHAQHDARHDELTGLPNRRLLSERVSAALATSALRNSGCAILVFDLDGFKPINDRYLHATGDRVLQEIAQRLLAIVRPQDTVARIGGDEFALLMPDCGSVQDVERIAQRILRELAQPLTAAADLSAMRLTASLGVAMAPEHGRDPEGLMRLADRAMYDAKIDGGNRVVFAGSAGTYADAAARRAS